MGAGKARENWDSPSVSFFREFPSRFEVAFTAIKFDKLLAREMSAAPSVPRVVIKDSPFIAAGAFSCPGSLAHVFSCSGALARAAKSLQPAV